MKRACHTNLFDHSTAYKTPLSLLFLTIFHFQETYTLQKMENLPDDVLLPIVRKIVASGIKNLFRFRATSVRHRKLVKNPEVIKALPRSCMFYLSDPQPCVEKCAFM